MSGDFDKDGNRLTAWRGVIGCDTRNGGFRRKRVSKDGPCVPPVFYHILSECLIVYKRAFGDWRVGAHGRHGRTPQTAVWLVYIEL